MPASDEEGSEEYAGRTKMSGGSFGALIVLINFVCPKSAC
jgi:hypothetical protein